jgi:membrane-bound lytic murein transglycosylase
MKNTKKLSTGKIKGCLVQEGSYIFFKPNKGENNETEQDTEVPSKPSRSL